MIRLMLLLGGLLMAPFAIAAQETGASKGSVEGELKELVIGVRSSARPFSYRIDLRETSLANLSAKSGPIRARGYDGYMVYICDEVLKQMLILEGHTPETLAKEIKVRDIDELMRGKPGTDRFTLLENGTIDILCDPATITRDRVRQFAVSPPLFLTGIGYLIRQGTIAPRNICEPKKALIGAVGTTNAVGVGIRAILDAGEWKRLRDDIISDMNGNEPRKNKCKLEKPKEDVGVIWEATTHKEVAEAFCNGDITYYVGDLQIIRAYANDYPGCVASSGVQSFTSDRYAVFANIDYIKRPWKADRIARFFEVLNREIVTSDSLLDRAYSATFGAAPRSEKLELFYWSMRGTP